MLAGLLLVCFVWVVFLIVVGLLLGFIMLKSGMEQQPQPLSLIWKLKLQLLNTRDWNMEEAKEGNGVCI